MLQNTISSHVQGPGPTTNYSCMHSLCGPLMQEYGDLLITPPTNLTLNLTLATEEEVQGGTNVSAIAVIQHVSVDPLGAYDLVVTFPDRDYQLNVSDNATASFSNGTNIIFGECPYFPTSANTIDWVG